MTKCRYQTLRFILIHMVNNQVRITILSNKINNTISLQDNNNLMDKIIRTYSLNSNNKWKHNKAFLGITTIQLKHLILIKEENIQQISLIRKVSG